MPPASDLRRDDDMACDTSHVIRIASGERFYGGSYHARKEGSFVHIDDRLRYGDTNHAIVTTRDYSFRISRSP